MHRKNATLGTRTRRPDLRVIAAVTLIAAAAVSGSCLFGTATNLCEQSGRRCSPGQTCAANQDICVDIGGCGDGIVNRDKGEVCDDGNIIGGDGCSDDCKSNETCGNGIVDIGADPSHPKETCDDGNTTPGDGCSATCKKENCGDGIFDPLNLEECDTGVDTQACNGGGAKTEACKIPRCGDGYTNKSFIPFRAAAPEECDNRANSDGESPDTQDCNGNNKGLDDRGSCRFPLCGDGYTNINFKPPGSIDPEQCDELDPVTHASIDTSDCNGNNHGNNGPGSCRTPSCGDHYTNPAFTPTGAGAPEGCDSGPDDTQGCNGNTAGAVQCQISSCGDGYPNTHFVPPGASQPENCDNKGGNDTSTCNGNNHGNNGPGSCRKDPSCGDGYTNSQFAPPPAVPPFDTANPGEECDTGSNNSDVTPNACRTDCRKAFCGDGVIDMGEVCDPGDSKHKAVGCTAPSSCLMNCTCS